MILLMAVDSSRLTRRTIRNQNALFARHPSSSSSFNSSRGKTTLLGLLDFCLPDRRKLERLTTTFNLGYLLPRRKMFWWKWRYRDRSCQTIQKGYRPIGTTEGLGISVQSLVVASHKGWGAEWAGNKVTTVFTYKFRVDHLDFIPISLIISGQKVNSTDAWDNQGLQGQESNPL